MKNIMTVYIIALCALSCASTSKKLEETKEKDHQHIIGKKSAFFADEELWSLFRQYRPPQGSLQSVTEKDYSVVFSHETMAFRSDSGCIVNLCVEQGGIFHLSEFATPEGGYRLEEKEIVFSEQDEDYLQAALLCIKSALKRMH